jgi:hypothetical protein
MHDSDELTSAFIELEGIVRGSTRLPGLAAARVEARRRSGRRVAWVAAAVVFVVAVGVTTVSLGWLRLSGAPVIGPSPSITTDPTPSPVLADLIPPERVLNAALDVPAFDLAGCPSGRVQFVDRAYVAPGLANLRMVTGGVGDVDADGAEDVVVALECIPLSGSHGTANTNVLAYSGPGLELLGAVAVGATADSMSSIIVAADGTIAVDTTKPSEGMGNAISQDRYRWTGSGFAAIDHTDFEPETPPNLAISVDPAAIELAPGGPPQTVLVTIHNNGPVPSQPLRLTTTSSSAQVTVDVEGLPGLVGQPDRRLVIAAPQTGGTLVVELRLSLPAGRILPAGATIVVTVSGHPSATGGGSVPPVATISLVAA